MFNGVLVINKPSGKTSHDVVNIVRRLFDIRRVGHTGTLDPMATGVLVLLLGPSTRLSQFMSHDEKRYRATLRFGVETTTYDADGDIVSVRPVKVEIDAIQNTLVTFKGEITQIPPMYSAIKIKGQKLYDLARKGKTVERQPRHITISEINVLSWVTPDLEMDVVCSSGTYIRSLAHDIGQALGCGAHLRSLNRTANHGFTLEESLTLEELEELALSGDLARIIRPPSAALGLMPVVKLSADQVVAVRNGQKIILNGDRQNNLIQALDPHGNLVAVMMDSGGGSWHPRIVLPVTSKV